MRIQKRSLYALLLGLGLSAAVAAHVRLIYSGNGQELSWSNPGNLTFVVQEMGSADVPGVSDDIALRNAAEVWNLVPDTTVQLVENTDPSQRARTDWASDDIRLLTFDENNSSGYFPGGSGVVAITPLEFFTSGSIIDADVIFNGKDFLFTTEGTPGRFDIQDVAAHELGHLLGLDHSGVAGSTMFPYVDPTIILHRSLSMDDIGGLRDIYPAVAFATITGTLKRSSDSSVVPGGFVIATDGFGRTTGSALADENGVFRIEGLPGGIYDVWADPLDQPVSSSNLTAGHTIVTNFESKYLGQVTVGNGQTQAMGDQSVDGDVAISLGRVADDYPLRVIAGRTVSRTVRGSGLVAGSTLTCSDPTVTITPTLWSGTQVTFDVTVPGNAPDGHIDLLVTNLGGDRDLLPGALEVTPKDPAVTNITPSAGPGAGSYAVTISGTDFRSGSRVVIGNRVYVDGEPGGCTVANATTIHLNLAATVAGPHDVVVIDSSGVEGRLVDGFTSQANPSISTTFPTLGASDGGTTVTLTGSNFVPGATVQIDGVFQSQVQVIDDQTLTFVTQPSVPGGPHTLLVENPGGEQASSSFVYLAQPDPRMSSVSPNSGPSGGGTQVTILGSGFTSNTQVRFGADPTTGQGGVTASEVTVVSANEIQVVSPASSSSYSSLMVQDSSTTQASVLSQGFTYNLPSGVDQNLSFGGCHAVSPARHGDWRTVMGGSFWLLLAYGILTLRLWAVRRA